MSSNISIQEGGVDKQFTVDKLRTNLVSGGTSLWVPGSDIQLTTKSINQNGTYKASDDGYYGYDKVIVNGVGKATGKDGDGDEAVVYTDPETGRLVKGKVPSYIRVITPPSNPYGIYQDGQIIQKDGMIVKAYLESDEEYGIVENDEITLDPSVAVYDESKDTEGEYSKDGVTASKYTFDSGGWVGDWLYSASSANKSFFLTIYNGAVYIAGDVGRISGIIYTNGHESQQYGSSISANVDVVFVATSSIFSDVKEISIPGSASNPSGVRYDDLMPEPAGSHQEITVSWPRPLDSKVLETTFEILVAPGYTPGGDE